MSSHRVVIVGGGFGGLNAALGLARVPVEVTLIDRCNFHLFQPLLYQVATGGLSPADITSPLRAVLKRQRNTRVLLDEVQDVDPARREVVLVAQGALAYDTLVLAAGAGHGYFGHDDWQAHAPGLKTIEDALLVRTRVLVAFERAETASDPAERAALLTFVIVGGGPTGVELAGAIGELARHTLRGEYRTFDPASARVLLIEADLRLLPSYPPRLSAAAQAALERLGIEVQTGTRVERIDEQGVILARPGGPERVRSATVLWAAGVSPSSLGRRLAERLGLELDRAGRVRVGSDLSVPGHPELFVLGDMALLEQDGAALAGVAAVAAQQGRHVARRIRDRERGEPTPSFRYRNRGRLAVIGRAAAVADLPHLRFTGYPAWLLWIFVHIMLLVEFENRVLVFIQWAFNYFTKRRGARLIDDRRPTSGRLGGPRAAPPAR